MDESAPLDQLLIGWSYWTAMRQRDLSFEDLGIELGVTKERVRQLLLGLDRNKRARDRIDVAITKATERKHVYEYGHIDKDPICAVITVAGKGGKVAQAKALGERHFMDAFHENDVEEAWTLQLTLSPSQHHGEASGGQEEGRGAA